MRSFFSSVAFRRHSGPALIIGWLTLFGAIPAVHGYVLSGPRWASDSTVTFQMSLGSAGRTLADGNTSWDAAAAPALATWNQSLLHVRFVAQILSSAPNSGDGINTIAYATTVFGQGFGSSTLAVTYYHYSNSSMIEADVLFNSAQIFDSYRGPLRFGSNGRAIADIRRVLVHELGHALGLSHPDQNGQQVDAIMNSTISDRELPAADDLAGAQSIYGVPIPVQPAIRSTTRSANGHIVLQGTAGPGLANRIEASASLTGGFSTVAVVTADSGGQFQFEDADAATVPNRFCRVAYP